jgi:hypothetical protein
MPLTELEDGILYQYVELSAISKIRTYRPVIQRLHVLVFDVRRLGVQRHYHSNRR